MTFLSCLEQGEKYERIALDYFPNKKNFTQTVGLFKEYDLIITNNDDSQTTVEVKADFMAYKTGNLAIEWECNNKPSGISSTTADIWIYFVIDKEGYHDCYKIPTNELQEISRKCRSVHGGDGGRSRLLLVPIRQVSKYKSTPHPHQPQKAQPTTLP